MKTVIHSFSYCVDYLCEQVADVREIDMVAQPNGFMNHPAWVIGHISYSCQAIGSEFGLSPWLPLSWRELFGTGSVPIADASRYNDKATSVEMLRDSQGRIINAVLRLQDAQLDSPLPDEGYRVVLPTIRHAITQVLIAHTANHVGQLTLWRHAMGLTRIGRPFA